MTAFHRVQVALAVYALILLLPSPAHGQKGKGFRLTPGRSPGTARGSFDPGHSGSLGPSARLPHPKGGGKFGTSIKILTSAAAAWSLGHSAQALTGYQEERAFLDRLRSRGLDQSDNCVFSIHFKTTGGFWADYFSRPDIFFYVDIEGQGSFLVPQIHWNYAGEPVLDRVLARGVRPGTKIVVRVLDDDTSSDEIWNGILKARVSISVSPEIQITRFISIKPVSVDAQIQLLGRNVVIDAPDLIASAEFVVPETKDGLWGVDGTLYDDSGKDVGDIQFACVQSDKGEWQQHVSAASERLGAVVFWLVLGSCLLIWFLRQVSSKGTPTSAGSQ